MSKAKAVADKGRDLQTLVEPLGQWLSEQWLTSVEISGFEFPIGAGHSNETVCFVATWTEGGQRRCQDLVLRVHPREEYQLFLRPRFRMQFDLLDALGRDHLVRVPKVLCYEADPALLGAPFFVMERMRGRVPVSSPVYNSAGWLHDASPAERRRLWESAVTELGRIHRAPLPSVEFLAQPGVGVPHLRAMLDEAAETLAWSAGPEEHPVLDDVLSWLRANFPRHPTVGLAWGDARIGNMMFDQTFDLVGVMDWEQANLAGGMTDLGWWLFFDEYHSRSSGVQRLPGLGTRQETISRWEEMTGRRVEDLLWYEVFAGFRLGMFPILMMRRGTGAVTGVTAEDNDFVRQVCRLLDMPPPRATSGS